MTHDAIVIGGGPGGSTAAWRLALAGARILVIDAAKFPRVKLCAGWVSPRGMVDLELDPVSYPLTLQPFAEATLEVEGAALATRWKRTVSYGIVREEFDHFLLERARGAGAEVVEGTRVGRVSYENGRAAVETPAGTFVAPLVIGAGGHHCPVARAFGKIAPAEVVVVTQESETRIGRERLAEFAPRPGTPELFPEVDLRGYGWYFSKGDFLNIGIGAIGNGRELHQRQRAFLDRLHHSGRLPAELPLAPFRGHAYALRARAPRRVAGPGFFLVGDAAALARNISGEGIAPAVASARIAAELAQRVLQGEGPSEVADEYEERIAGRFGAGELGWIGLLFEALPRGLVTRLGTWACRQAWLRRRLVFEGAFGMG